MVRGVLWGHGAHAFFQVYVRTVVENNFDIYILFFHYKAPNCRSSSAVIILPVADPAPLVIVRAVEICSLLENSDNLREHRGF